MDKNQNITELLELANHYPSPHNGQPIRLKIQDNDNITMFFDRDRGLQSTEVSFIFSFVSMGVFVEHLKSCARALGHEAHITLELPKAEDLHGTGVVSFGTCQIVWNMGDRDEALLQTIRKRHTSRKKYTEKIDEKTATDITAIARDGTMQLAELSKEESDTAIWLNQRAVFDDMFDEPVRRELDHWLRYSQTEKQAKRDGLAYDCMELNGKVMKFIVNHPKILRTPGISWLLEKYYLRTMADASTVFYMLAPFETEEQSYKVGEVILKIWLALTARDYYLHPFGTIMSNQAAHRDFIELAKIQNESRDKSYLVFIFRAGKSEQPVPSLRIDYTKHLMME